GGCIHSRPRRGKLLRALRLQGRGRTESRSGRRKSESEAERSIQKSQVMGEDDFDPESRQLCADGSCTGVLGDDGRCKECGKSASGDEAPVADSPSEGAGDDGFEDRQLCTDGNCTGLIGPDGRCKQCGKPS